MQRPATFETVLEQFERDLERVQEKHSARFSALVKAKTAEWDARFPRHNFRAWEGHGLLSFEIVPGIGGSARTFLELEEPRHLRGAWAEIVSEARAIVDAFDSTDTRRPLYFID